MHPATAFHVDDEATLLAHLAAHPFCTLAAVLDGRPVIAHAPVFARRAGQGVVLDFHLSRNNALAAAVADGFRAVAVSLAADAYISPDWYADKNQVPTWNYVSVEAEGAVGPINADELVALLDDLSAQEEGRLLPKTPWTRHKMTPGKFEAMQRGIVGARLVVERFAGTNKLSQNKGEDDRAGVVAALGDHPIGRRMRAL